MEPQTSFSKRQSSTIDQTKAKAPAVDERDASKVFSVTIGCTPKEVYSFWRDLKNLPIFMKELKRIQILSKTRSRWTVQGEKGPELQWDAEIVEDIPDTCIAWKSDDETFTKTAGKVWFEPAPQNLGTIVRLAISYDLPGGSLGAAAATLMGEKPDYLVHVNLRRLKAYLETNEIPTIDGQPTGKDAEEIKPSKESEIAFQNAAVKNEHHILN